MGPEIEIYIYLCVFVIQCNVYIMIFSKLPTKRYKFACFVSVFDIEDYFMHIFIKNSNFKRH